jgi:hypothetical protein
MFRGALCYIDAYLEGATHPTHLVRLRFFPSRHAHESEKEISGVPGRPRSVMKIFRQKRPHDDASIPRHPLRK